MASDDQGAFTPRKTAKYLAVSDAALRLWRAEKRGPPWYRAGKKLVRYRKSDLDRWIESRLNDSAA
jgi:predicted DNA-binding transcriptional regulator AlpA